MNETKFIKTVTFGGYDKADTDEHIKALYSRIATLESELKIAQTSLAKYRTGTDPKLINDALISEIRAELAECQAENKSLTGQLKSAMAENKKQENEINTLKYSVAELEHNLSDADMKLLSMSQKDDTAVFGAVFASAKKSASEIIENAQKKASDIEEDSKKLAENIVAEANNKAADIVYEAEVYAAEMTAEVSDEKMEAISGNIKALLLEDVNSLSSCMEKFRQSFAELLSTGNNILEKSGNMLSETRNTLIQGGMPVFQNIEIEADLPEKPVYEKTDYSYISVSAENKQEINDNYDDYDEDDYQDNYSDNNKFDSYDYDYDEDAPNFEELDAVDILDDEDDFDLSGLVRNANIGGGGVNFKALDRQAEEFMGKKKPESNDAPSKKEKSGSINLAELATQADALSDDTPSPPKKAKSGGIDLATLAAQAAALDD
ncbi:MAG: DivIVA domain-containing protein [Ruminococcus sp.]|nr:DivIVA domain-containing protein [Ruminococcus sp.]